MAESEDIDFYKKKDYFFLTLTMSAFLTSLVLNFFVWYAYILNFGVKQFSIYILGSEVLFIIIAFYKSYRRKKKESKALKIDH